MGRYLIKLGATLHPFYCLLGYCSENKCCFLAEIQDLFAWPKVVLFCLIFTNASTYFIRWHYNRTFTIKCNKNNIERIRRTAPETVADFSQIKANISVFFLNLPQIFKTVCLENTVLINNSFSKQGPEAGFRQYTHQHSHYRHLHVFGTVVLLQLLERWSNWAPTHPYPHMQQQSRLLAIWRLRQDRRKSTEKHKTY